MEAKDLTKTLQDISAIMEEIEVELEKDCNNFWDCLSDEDKLRAFYSVCSRIHKGDVLEGKSYRGVLYDTFKFNSDSYGVGIQCGYLGIHNLIQKGKEYNPPEAK